jgi:putative heme-binding domain-containing protein
VNQRGGSLGPDLTDIGVRRTAAELRRSITDPDAEIEREYLTVVLTTKSGQHVEGIALNEDDISIQVRDAEGNPRSFLKANLRDLHREQRSLMPSYRGRLSAAEIESVVSYLRTLRGTAPAGPEGTPRREPGPLTTDLTWQTRANRDAQERPERLLDSLGIAPGATVVDLGAGSGYFTWRLAQRVGLRGKVLAVDVQQAMLDRVAAEIGRRHLQNVELVLGTETDPKLPVGAADLVLIANAYHEFRKPEEMLAAVRKSLKARGRLVVVEYAEEREEDPVAGLYTMRLDQLRAEVEGAGFRLDRILDFLPIQHGLIFTVMR